MILLRIFKNNRTSGAVALVILALAVFARSFILGVEPGGSGEMSGYYGMPFYNLIFGAIHTKPILNNIIALLLVIFLGYTLIRIGVRYLLLDYRSLMPGIFFLFFIMALPSTQQVSPALIGSIFYLFCIAILFDAHDKEPNTFSIFTASFILVLGSMFYLKMIWFYSCFKPCIIKNQCNIFKHGCSTLLHQLQKMFLILVERIAIIAK